MYFFKTPALFKYLYPNVIWQGDRNKKQIFLTFDDGPVPGITDYVLDVLSEFGIKATFFCVGENVAKHPATFERLLYEGHGVGNHTYNHLDGWKINLQVYLDNIYQSRDTMINHGYSSDYFLFRPPYGKLKKGLSNRIDNNFKIIMWDVLAYDFSTKISAERCLQESIKHTRNGSIVLFHDSQKTIQKLKIAIPQYIAHFLNENYEFCRIDALFLH